MATRIRKKSVGKTGVTREWGKKFDDNDVKMLETKRDIKKSRNETRIALGNQRNTKRAIKASTAKERAGVKKTRARALSMAFQTKQASDTTKETIKSENDTRKEIARINAEVEKERIKSGQNKGPTTNDAKSEDIINGGMTETTLGGTSTPTPKDPDNDGDPGFSWGMI